MQNLFFINTDDEYSFLKHYKPCLKKISPEYREMAVSTYDADASHIEAILDEVSSISLVPSNKIITIKNYDKLASKKEFLNLLNSIDSNTFLFLQKDSPKTPAALSDFIKNNRNKILEINLYKVGHETLLKRIGDYLREANITYEKNAIEKYASIFENQEDLLMSELQKIDIYMNNDSRHFSESTLDDILSLSFQFNIFEMVKLFFSKNKTKALIRIRSFIQQSPNDFVGFQSLLLKEAKRIIVYKELEREGLSQKDIFKKMGIVYPISQESLLKLTENFTLNEITKITDYLCDMELFLKTSSLQAQSVDRANVNLKAYQQLLKIICFMGKT